MTVFAKTADSAALLRSIKKLIDEGKIETWSYDKDGDLTHTPQQWRLKAWMRPLIRNGVLEFHLICPKDEVLSKAVYGVYHGRLIEMLLTHFDDVCSSAEGTAHQAHYSTTTAS